MRIVCPCGREMRCVKNSMNVSYESGTIFSGDKYGCPDCDNSVVLTAEEPLAFGFNPTATEHDVKMNSEE